MASSQEAARHATQDAPNGIESPITGVHLFADAGPREIPVMRGGESQRVVAPVAREIIGRDPVLVLHLIPQARSGQGGQEQRVENIHAVVVGRLFLFAGGLFLISPMREHGDAFLFKEKYLPPRGGGLLNFLFAHTIL